MQRYSCQRLLTSWAGVAGLVLSIRGALAEPVSRDSPIKVSPGQADAGEGLQRRNWLNSYVRRSENTGSGKGIK